MGLLEDTKKIYNWEPSDGDYFIKENDPEKKNPLKVKLKKNIPFTSVVVLILILLSVFFGYYLS